MARTRTVVRRSFGGRRSPGRLTEWFGKAFASDTIALPAASFVIDSSLTATGVAKIPFTITRTIGLLSVMSDQNAAVEVPFGAFGMRVVSAKALATGPTAVPDPVTEVTDDGWYVYQPFSCEGTLSSNAGRPIMQFPFDSRAQRKVEDGDQVVAMMANASAADGLLYVLNLRFLVKLS